MDTRRALLLAIALGGATLVWTATRYARAVEPARAETAGPTAESGEAVTLRFYRNPKAAPQFVARDLDGHGLSTASLRGKVVIINFWATWCGPCKVEIPEFVELYSQYKDRGFVILGVLSQDTPTKDQLQAFLTENKMEYPILYSSEKLESAFDDLWALPTTFLISRDGAMCAKQLGPASKEDVERSLKALL